MEKNNKRVTGIVLAAGLSSRMGQLKQLLPVGGIPSVIRVVRVLSESIDDVIVILGHMANHIGEALENENCSCVFNEEYEEGMLSSIQCGLRSIEKKSSYIIALGDQPQIKESTVSRLLKKGSLTKKGIVIPKFKGRRGHPIFISSKYKDKIQNLDRTHGLNFVTRKYANDVLEMETDESEILKDMDTFSDYIRINQLLHDGDEHAYYNRKNL